MDLELASFAEIAEELSKRFENSVIIGHRAITHDPTFNANQKYSYDGDPNTLLGLLDTVHYDVLMSKMQSTETE